MVQDASALIAAGTVNAGQMNRACMDVPITIHPVDAAALLNIKSTLGVTYTTWTATSPCRLFGSSVGFPGEWNGVWCNGDGKAVLFAIASLTSFSSPHLRPLHAPFAFCSPLCPLHAPLCLLHAPVCLLLAPFALCSPLPRRSLTSNFFNYRIDSFTSSMKALPNLVDIEAPYNYLMGTVPPVGASLVVLNMAFNFLTDFPTFSCTTCGGNNNCLTTPSKCPSGGTVQRAAAECVYCGTNGVPPLCWGAGGVCTVDASVPIAAGTGSKALTTPLARTCVSNGCGRAAHVAIGGVCGGSGGAAALPAEGGGRGGAVGPASTPQGPYPAPTCSPMLTLKSLLGVTFTSWAASVPCKIAGQSTTVTTWSGVLCDSTGSVLSIGVSNANLKGSLPAAVSLLSALTYLGVASNCLTGTVPALSSGLRTLDVRYNFLTDVPAVTYTYCGGNNNCLLTPSKCATAGSTQRPTADCAICGTTNAVGPFCTASGGVYMPDAAANVAAGTVNAPVLPLLFMGCTGGTNYMYPSDAVALLNIKSAMGLTFTSWATTTPCLAEGTSPNWDEWERVTCTPFGRLYSMRLRCNYLMGTLPASITNFKSLDIAAALLNIKSTLGVAYTTWTATSPCRLFGSSVGFSGEWNGVWCNGDGKAVLFAVDGLGLKGSLHADMSALTALTRVSLMSNFFNYRIDSFTSSLKDLPNLVDIRMHINYLYGEIPSFLVNIPKITQLEAPYNYLMGTVPPVRAGLVVLNMAFNFLTDFPTFSYSTCGGNNNCLTTPSKCPSGGTEECARWTLSVPTAAGTGSKSLTTPLARTCVGGAVVGIKVSNGCGRAAHVVNGGSLKGVMVMRAVGVACHAGPQVFAGRHIHQLGGKCAVHAGLAEHHIHNLEWRGLRLQYNYLFGEVPSFLVGLPKLTQLYVPLATGLLTLDARFNYLTDLPTAAYKSCSGNNNFLVTPSKCNAAGTVQRTAAECSFYGTTNGVGPFCTATGGACMVNAYDNVDGGIVNSATQPAVPLFCLFPPVAMKDSAAMLAIKSSLGVTYTTWAASVPCKLPGQIARVAIWTGVSCDSTGSVVGIGLENANLLGSLAMEISTLSALTYLSLSANLLNYRIDSFTTYLRFLPVLADIGAMNNYLMGSIPALASGLRTLDIRYNFIADLPAVTYSSYNGTGNCLIAPSKCGSSGIDQRPPAECAFCSSTNAMGPYCWGGGGVCTVDAFVYVFGSYVNAGSTPGLATCVGGTVVAIQESAAMLALKSSLGITTNTWAASVACTLKGTTAPVPTWAGVLYDSSGNVVSIEMKNTGLAGAPPADISKLTTLTYLNLNSQLFQAPLTDFTSNLLKLTGLKELYLQYNWFFGSVPTALLRLPSLCVLGLGFNYLTGSFPGSATLVTLDIRSNFFYTMAPMTLKWCDGSNNCLASPAPCASGGSTQRAAADCAICASVGAVPPFCRGTGTCSPDSGPAAALGTPNSATAPMLPMVCSGIPIDPADALVLLTLKSTLSVTLSNWNAASLCTLEGQTLLPAQWGGVRCTAAGKRWSGSTCNVGAGAALAVPHALCLSLIHRLSCSSLSLPRSALTRQSLQSILHLDISKLTTLTYLDLGYNLFQGRLDLFAAPLKPLTTLKALFFHYNYFAGSIPSAIATLPQLTSLGLFSNYLTGTVPIPSKALVALDVGFNFLSGTFPKLPLMFCAGDNNCFLNSTACRTYGIVQRPAGACAICGTVAGQGDLCFGGSCAPLASAAVTASTVNSPNQPILPMACADNPAAPMDTGSALALLNVKSALGVTFTSWLAASPCAIANSTIAVAGTWTGVLCSSAGDVLSVNLSSAVAGTIHTDITKLTALTYLSVPSPTCQCPHLPVSALTYLSVPLSFYLSSPPLPHCLIRCPLRSISMSLLACFLPACPPHMRAATEQASSTSTLPFLPTPAPAPCTLSPVHPLSDLSNNFLRGSLDKFVTFSGLKTLLQLRLNNNWFVGSLPQTLMSFSALSLLDVHANALTGSFPAVSSVLRALYLHDNFLAGSFTTSSLTACDPSLNCFLNAVACGATSTTQRAAAACAICDSPAAQGQLCWGGTCMPKVSPTTAHPDGLAPPAMYCAAQALGALKNVMGVTFTTSDPATYCTVAPTAIVPGTWDGVLCDSAGKVVSLSVRLLYPCCALLLSMHWLGLPVLTAASACQLSLRTLAPVPSTATSFCTQHLQLANSKLTGTLPLSVSALTALTAIDLTSNLFDLAYNWLSSSVPAYMLTLPSLTELTIGYNYLTGALPPVTPPLSVVDVQFNFLAGTFPMLTLTLCAARMNCFLDATKCKNPNRASELPRAAASCAICNTTNAQGRLCNGGVCTVNATDLVALGAPNSAASPSLPLICVGAAFVAMDAVHAGAMLNIKASLGVTFTDWKAGSPCSLPGGVAAGSWSRVTCDGTGKVLGIDLQSNLLQGRLDSFTASIKTPLVLKELLVTAPCHRSFFNYLSGQFPTALLALTTLSKLSVGYNYLTGPFPTVPASAKSLDVQGNFLSGAFPTNALTYCDATTNCLTDANNCASLGITQRSATDCAICGTAFGQGTLCGGVPCLVNTTGVTAPPTATSPPCNLYCTPVALDTNTTTTLLALKTVLGVTATEWSATTVALKPKALKSSSVPLATMVGACTVEGQTPAPGSWTGVFCNSAGAIVALLLPNQKLTGSLSTDIAKLTALTALRVGAPAFTAPSLTLQPLPQCMNIHPPCPLAGRCSTTGSPAPSPSAQLALPALSSALPRPPPVTPHPPLFQLCRFHSPPSIPPTAAHNKLNRNYLTGVVPAMGAAVKVLNMAGNFLSASFPTTGVTACDARSNCFTDASKCANTLGTAQRATADCNVCGSTGAAGPLCGGGFCIPNAAAPAAAGTPNIEGQALLTMSCVGGPIEVNMRGAMLNLKASLGVTLTDWAAASPCTIAGQPSVPGAWTNVVCDTAGKVVSIDLTNQLLKGSMHADITKLTILTSFNAKFNYLAGPLPSALLTLPTLTSLDVSYSYLTGTVPALGTALKNLRIGGNYLSGSIGTLSGVTCSALFNCLTSQGSCTTGGTQNRVGCAICGSTNAQSTLCGGGMCVPDATAAVESNTTPTLSTPAVPMYCTGVIMDATAGDALLPCPALPPILPHNVFHPSPPHPYLSHTHFCPLVSNTLCDVRVTTLANIKTALGVTFTDWVAPTALLKPKAAGRTGSGSVAPTDWLTTGRLMHHGRADPRRRLLVRRALQLPRPARQPVSVPSYPHPLQQPCFPSASTALPDALPLLLFKPPPMHATLAAPNLPPRHAPPSSPPHAARNLNNQRLTGSFHADISKLSLLTVLERPWGHVLVAALLAAIMPFPPLASLPAPSAAARAGIELNMNALTGTFPAPISTALKRLLVDRNFMAGTFPANSATYCTAYGNCIFSYTMCNSLYPNSPVGNCNYCGTTNGLGTACMGNPCMPVTPSPITATNRWDPMPTMRCDPVPVHASQAAALQAMVPGLWTQPMCTLAGQAYVPGMLPLAFGNPAGMVLDMYAPFAHRPARPLLAPFSHPARPLAPCSRPSRALRAPCSPLLAPCSPCPHQPSTLLVLSGVKANGFFPTDSSKLSALTKLCLHQNYFSGSFPASISALTALTELRLNLNYLTGSMPAALPASLKVIDLSSNYLVGTFPTTTATSVACASNCLQDASKCPAGSAQRAAAACAICETRDARGRMCGGGICTPNTTVAVAAGTMNTGSASLYCLGASMDSIMAAALLNVKASLGVTFTDWALDSPCTIQGLPPLPDAWSNVVCNVSGKVMSINLGQQRLQGTMHADISKLTSLTYINLRSNFLEGRLDVFAANFKALTALKEAYLDFNWFTGPIPSTLVTIATLSTFGASYNYLYGSMPAPGTALKTLTLDGNWLSGTFPGTGFSSCSATANCLASISACTTLGTVQRAAAACAVCDTADGSGTVCGGGTCAPDTAVPLASSTPNSATAAVLPRFCVGVPLDATQGNILLALKTTLGATFSDWTAATLAAPKATSTKPKKGSKRRVLLQGRGSGLL
ncbi:unnamed protein product, partial [Closterium sp. NIES-64]